MRKKASWKAKMTEAVRKAEQVHTTVEIISVEIFHSALNLALVLGC